jgi:hypothetical protein
MCALKLFFMKEEFKKAADENFSDMFKLKQKYHVGDKEIHEAINAVGNDHSKVEAYLKEAFGKTAGGNKQIHPENIAVNPNPRANANIKDEIKNKTSSQLKEEKQQPGNEITDGEDG